MRRSATENAPIVIDSSVLIAYLADEAPISGIVAPLLEHVAVEVVMSMITLSEILVRPARTTTRSEVGLVVSSLLALPNLHLLAFDRDHAVEAAIVRAETHLKLPDSAVIATARLAEAVALIGNDRGWIGKLLRVPYVHMDDLLSSIREATDSRE